MKKIYKIFFISILLLFIIPLNANAQDLKSFNFISISNDLYSYEQIKIYNRDEKDFDDKYIVGNKLSDYCIWSTIKKEDKLIKSITMWENSDYIIKEGLQNINIVLYVPLDGKIIITIQINGEIGDTKENLKNTLNDSVKNTNEDLIPTLTVSSLILDTNTKYDINVENTIYNSKYKWTVSNSKIININRSTGKITAISKGKSFVYCTITTPDKQVIVLKCKVTVN